MKKLLLLVCVLSVCVISNAQLTLTGTSYTQNFDGIASGLPVGWGCYIGATSTSLGSTFVFNNLATAGVFDTNNVSCSATARAHGFKNYPSADTIHALDTCGTQIACPNRALGLRQVSPATVVGFDSGAALVLNIQRTLGMSGFHLTFKLQSLDITSDHLTTWAIDYGTGATPTAFTPVTTTGYMTTGGGVFSNTTITVNFGTALDNLAVPVWIRLVTLTASTTLPGSGAGYRPSTAIDDFALTYANTGTGTEGISEVSPVAALSLSAASTTPGKISLVYTTQQEGNYNLYIYDLAGRILYTENIYTVAGSQTKEITGLNLAPGMYFARMSNSNSSSVAKIIVQ